MTFGEIRKSSSDYNRDYRPSGAPEASDIVFEFKKKQERVKKSNIKDIAKSLAEIAYSTGETNDPEEFAEWIEEDITEAIKKVKRRQDKKKKKKR